MKASGLVFKSRDYVGSVEPPATNLEDESRWRNTGVFLGAGQPDWVRLPSGLWILLFDGDNDKVTILNTRDFADGESWSFSAWLKPPDAANQRFLNVGVPYWMFHGPPNESIFLREPDLDYHSIPIGSYGNVWQHIVIACDGVGNISVYRDGIYKGVITPTSTALPTVNLGSKLNGYMALIKFWDYPLNPIKVGAIYQAERHFFGV